MARHGGNRRRWVGAAMVAGVALTWSSVAWACTLAFGKMTITGQGTGVVTVVGNNQSMGWCSPYPLGKAKATRGGTITITVKKAGPDECVPPGSRLPAGTYDVNYFNGEAFARQDVTDKSNWDGTRGWIKDCMTDPFPDPELPDRLGTMVVDSFGKGTGTYTIPATGVASTPTDEAAICVSEPAESPQSQYGLQAPLTIL